MLMNCVSICDVSLCSFVDFQFLYDLLYSLAKVVKQLNLKIKSGKIKCDKMVVFGATD